MKAPVFDPPVPYSGLVSGGRFYFSPGKLIRIVGVTSSFAKRFDVNLQCGPEITPTTDIAIQISIQLLANCLSVNSLHEGVWGEEWRSVTLPIKRAEMFEIIIECDFNQYKVVINGQLYGEFPQRIRYDRITHLVIDGDVSIKKIFYESVSRSAMGAAFVSRFAGVSGSAALASGAVVRTNRLEESEMVTANIASPEVHISSSSKTVDSFTKAAVDGSNQLFDSKKVLDSTTGEEVTDACPYIPADAQVFFNPASTKFQPRLQPVSNFSGSKVGVGCAIIVTFVIIITTLIVKTAIQEQ